MTTRYEKLMKRYEGCGPELSETEMDELRVLVNKRYAPNVESRYSGGPGTLIDETYDEYEPGEEQ